MPWRTTVVLAAAAALSLWSPQPAPADTAPADQAPSAPAAYPDCNATLGNLEATYKNGNWATLEIFWDAANGTNCAYLRHGSAAPGGEIFTEVYLWTCTTSVQGEICNPRGPVGSRYFDRDLGNFNSYAGKVVVDGRNRCIYAWGALDTNGDGQSDRYIDVNNSTSSTALPWSKHCG